MNVHDYAIRLITGWALSTEEEISPWPRAKHENDLIG